MDKVYILYYDFVLVGTHLFRTVVKNFTFKSYKIKLLTSNFEELLDNMKLRYLKQ